MLLVDNFREIGYHTDYFTTISLLQALPLLNTDDFWEDKWHFMYNRPYIPFFTDQDNFLIRERSSFVLLFNSPLLYKNILFEKDQLQEKLEIYSNKINLEYVEVDVKKQYVVIKNHQSKYYVEAQFDNFDGAEDYIENDVMKIGNLIAAYSIVDMDKIVICFNNVKMQRKPNEYDPQYYHSMNFKRFGF